MPRQLPPIEHRFTKGNAPRHTQKGPYLLPLLKKFLNKKIDYIDPETNLKIQGRVKDAVIWRLLLNACQGENDAIKEVLNRVDGKVPDVVKEMKDDSELFNAEIELIPSNGKKIPNRIKGFISN